MFLNKDKLAHALCDNLKHNYEESLTDRKYIKWCTFPVSPRKVEPFFSFLGLTKNVQHLNFVTTIG